MGKFQDKSYPNYKNPPVIEVVTGVVFNRISEFKIPHMGLFWKRFLSDFPKCVYAPPLDINTSDFSNNVFPVPRIWFTNAPDDRLVQLQDNRFYYNWRARPKSRVYPRYPEIYASFEKYWSSFIQFIKELGLEEIVLSQCELTYINHIPRDTGASLMSDIGAVFPDLGWRATEDRFLPDPTHVAWQSSFDLPENMGRMRVKVQEAQLASDKTPIFVLELAATGLAKDKSLSEIDCWFQVAHEWIVRGFEDLTSINVQKDVWGKVISNGK